MALRTTLQRQGLLSAEVEEWTHEEEAESLADLAHAFRSADDVTKEAPYLLNAWLAASRLQPESWQTAHRIRTACQQARLREKQVSDLLASSLKGGHAPRRYKKPRTAAAKGDAQGKPRAQAFALAKHRDAEKRQAAAIAAVDMSISWGPEHGVHPWSQWLVLCTSSG